MKVLILGGDGFCGWPTSLRADDKLLTWVPLYHDWGLVCVALHALAEGIEYTLQSPIDWVRDPVIAWKARASSVIAGSASTRSLMGPRSWPVARASMPDLVRCFDRKQRSAETVEIQYRAVNIFPGEEILR